MTQEVQTRFYHSLSDDVKALSPISSTVAMKIFNHFKNSSLFRWTDSNNDCEDRANAICILLDEWRISNCKAWVFSGSFLKKDQGLLTNCWKYHVAAALPVQEGEKIVYYVIDPATQSNLSAVEDWAFQITQSGNSYHFIKQSHYYIFPTGKIDKDNWYKRNRRNHNWTMQGLSGINGASVIGKAQLAFQKRRVKQTVNAFTKMKNNKPLF